MSSKPMPPQPPLTEHPVTLTKEPTPQPPPTKVWEVSRGAPEAPPPPPKTHQWGWLEWTQPPYSYLNDIHPYLSDKGNELLHSLPAKELERLANWWRRNKPPSEQEIAEHVKKGRR
jgi:hypothetical protein